MAKVKVPQAISNSKDWEELMRYASQSIEAIVTELNGRLSLQDNAQTERIAFTFSSANQEVGQGHGLGFIPNGYLQISSSTGAVAYDGANANTKDTIYLRATGAGTITVLVF